MRLLTLEIGPELEGLALRDVVRRRLKISRALYRRIRDAQGARLDGVEALPFHTVRAGQVLTLDVLDRPSGVAPGPVEIVAVHEDEHVVVVDKPAGVVVHPTHGVREPTLAAGLAARYGTFHLVHRLDRDTSGLLVVARDPLSAQRLVDQLSRRVLERTYRAIAHGLVEADVGIIDAPVARREGLAHRVIADDGQPARTHFRVLERRMADRQTWLELRLETGRTHQIRVHLAHLGHPVLGDERYGPPQTSWPRLCLHAARVAFLHPRTGARIAVSSPWPLDLPL